MPRSDWWACCTAVHYNKYLQIGKGGYNMPQLWIQQIAKVFLVGRKSNSTQIRSPWRPFEILSPDGVDPDSLKMLAKTTDKARCRGDNVISSHCNFSQEFLHAMRCDMRHMWHALHSHEYGILAVLPNAFLKQVEVILQWIQRLITLLDCTWFILPFVREFLVIPLDMEQICIDLYWQVEYVQRCHCCGPTCGYSSISRAIQRDSELTKCECLGANSDKRRPESEAQHAIMLIYGLDQYVPLCMLRNAMEFGALFTRLLSTCKILSWAGLLHASSISPWGKIADFPFPFPFAQASRWMAGRVFGNLVCASTCSACVCLVHKSSDSNGAISFPRSLDFR